MEYIDTHQKKWEELHSQPQFQLKFPNEMVIRFIKSNFKHPSQTRILDLGCGAGRHITFMAKEGYCVTGIDFSKTGLEYVRKTLNKLSLQAELVHGSIAQLPFPDNHFDGIVSFAVIYYFRINDIELIIKEIHRTLKSNGKAFIVVRSTNDKRYGKGELLEDNTYRMTSDFSNEDTMTIHFFTVEEIKERFSMFSEVSIGLLEDGFSSLNEYDSDLLITVTK